MRKVCIWGGKLCVKVMETFSSISTLTTGLLVNKNKYPQNITGLHNFSTQFSTLKLCPITDRVLTLSTVSTNTITTTTII